MLIIVAMLVAATARPCEAQFVRVPVVVVPRPPVHFHMPHIPHGTNNGAGDVDSDTLVVIFEGIVLAAAFGAAAYLVHVWRKKSGPRARIRIIGLPPGEAPVWVRYAWLGLELPLIPGQVRSNRVAAQQVLSLQPVMPPPSYAVDGKTAIEVLASASPEAAAWWRQWAPAVLAPGYQLVFPAANCERLDDLGA
jgi:hypothetical protein